MRAAAGRDAVWTGDTGKGLAPFYLIGSRLARHIADDWFYQSSVNSLVSGPEGVDPRAEDQVLSPGRPVYARSLTAGMSDVWLVPVMAAGKPITVIAVNVGPDGMAGSAGGSGHDTFPRWSESAARTLGSIPGDPVVTAELVWGHHRGAYATTPFWRLVRRSGDKVHLFDEGDLFLPDGTRR